MWNLGAAQANNRARGSSHRKKFYEQFAGTFCAQSAGKGGNGGEESVTTRQRGDAILENLGDVEWVYSSFGFWQKQKDGKQTRGATMRTKLGTGAANKVHRYERIAAIGMHKKFGLHAVKLAFAERQGRWKE